MGCGGCAKRKQQFLETQAKVKKESEEKFARLAATGTIDKNPPKTFRSTVNTVTTPPLPVLSRQERIARRKARIDARNARIAARNSLSQKQNPQI